MIWAYVIFSLKYKMAKKYDLASQCAAKAFEINPDNMRACSMLLLLSLGNHDFDNFFKYLETLDKKDEKFSHKKFNLILYLINFLTKVPEKYNNYLNNLTVNDLYEKTNDEEINKYNKAVAGDVFHQSFGHLIGLINTRIDNNFLDEIELLIYKLVSKVANYHEEFNEKLITLIKVNNYEQALLLLEKKEKNDVLSKLHNIIKVIMKKMIDVKKNNVTEVNVTKTSSVLEALENNNFKLALEIEQNYEKNKIQKGSNFISVVELLEKLCDLAEKSSLEISFNEKQIEFDDIMVKLHTNNLKDAIKDLKAYLIKINKLEYEFLIIDLIKISLLKKDLTFSEPITILSQLSNDSLQCNISTYIQQFYLCLSNNKIDECKVYLDIISNFKVLGQDYLFIDKLEQSLETYDKKANNLDMVNELIGENVNNVCVEQNRLMDYCETPLNGESLEDFVKRMHTMLLINKGIVLVSNLANNSFNDVKNIINNYPDLRTLTITDDNEERLVIRYAPWVNKAKTTNEFSLGKEAFANKRYEESIRLFKEVIITHRIRPYSYGKIGLAYLKLHNYRESLKYLIVAHSLSMEQNDNFDFTELISRLKNEFYNQNSNELEYVDYNNFGLGNISDITDYIVRSGFDVFTACKMLKMNNEEIYKLMLVYARDFYLQGDIIKGDEFVNFVEPINDLSGEILNIVEEVKNIKYNSKKKDKVVKLSRNLIPTNIDSQ